MAEHVTTPVYRYRGGVAPSAQVSRPVSVHMAAPRTDGGASGKTSATLDIFDVIDSYGGWWGISAADVDAALKQIGDVDTLHVRINSPGGEATEGVAIASLLRAHAADVQVSVIGLAASAASVIAIAGTKLTMAPGSMLMVHEARCFSYGFADDLRADATMLDKICDSYASLYALKGGGTVEQWRVTMRDTTWMTADDAVTAKLADEIGLVETPAPDLPDEADEDDPDFDITVTITPAARAAARFDLSMYEHVPAALASATKTPATPPVIPTNPKEADTMSDTLIKALREQFGLAEDADESVILAKANELVDQATKPVPEPAPAAETDPKSIRAALEAEGFVVMSKTKADALTEQAEQGAQARAKQLTDERDELIEVAMAAGKISRSDASKTSWQKEFARDFDLAKAELESMPARFPVGQLSGHQGNPEADASSQPFTDEDAATLAAMAGASKEALLS